MTSTLLQSFDPQHGEMVHDVKMDYYGTRMATCGSDGIVKIFDVGKGEKSILEAELKGHEAAAVQVAWSHPQQGGLLASCGYDRKVIVWKPRGKLWEIAYVSEKFRDCVNYLSWAPHEHGILLACSSFDGTVFLIGGSSPDCSDFTLKSSFIAHNYGCLAVSWEPVFKCIIEDTEDVSESSDVTPQDSEPLNQHSDIDETKTKSGNFLKRLVTGGVDGKLKIWCYDDGEGKWIEQNTLEGHSDWVRDVAWAPPFITQRNMIASGSQDMKVLIWTADDANNWSSHVLNEFKDVVWTVSWSEIGNALAVTVGDGEVSLWKQDDTSKWVHVLDVEETKQKKPEASDKS